MAPWEGDGNQEVGPGKDLVSLSLYASWLP